MHPIKKAVFPVAGLGSRFLPATKASPKEMLPIVDKPLIQYAVEEAIRAGITQMIFVTNSNKRVIEDHFDRHLEYEMFLEEQGKMELLSIVKNITPCNIQFIYIRQSKPLGLGHAVLCAEHVVGKEPFAVLLADDLIDEAQFPCLAGMVEIFHREGNSIIGVQKVPWDCVDKYGVVTIKDIDVDYSSIQSMEEKPAVNKASSNLAAMGRYLFTPTIFSCLKQISFGVKGELQLTDGIQTLLNIEMVKAYQFYGKRYDCGSKLGYLQATVEFGLRHNEIGGLFRQYIKTIKNEIT